MSGQDTTQNTQSQSVTQLPPWINQAAQANYAFGQNVAMRPLQQYQGQMVADIGPQTQQAFNTAAQGANAGQNQYDASQAGYMGVMGQQPQQVTPNTLAGANLTPYLNSYTQDVINKTLPIMQQQLGQQQIGNQSQAAGAGAYGGSRQGIQQGVTQAQGAQSMAQMAAQLSQQNFQQAQAGAQYDISNNMQGQLANQAAQQNQAGLNLQAAGGLAGLGNAAQANQVKNFSEQMMAGQLEQQQAQNIINANQQKFNQAWNYPNQQLSLLQSGLMQTPYEQAQQGQSTTQTSSSLNPLNAVMSGLQGLTSLFSGGATSPWSGITSALGGGSDRRLKTDITKVGHHPAGVPIYAYRYKGDSKSYPKVVGPMAEDVQKIAPHAVSVIPGSGGKRAVDMSVLHSLGGMGRGRGPVVGPLASAAPAGLIGALGGSLAAPPRRTMRMTRPPPIRGALGG